MKQKRRYKTKIKKINKKIMLLIILLLMIIIMNVIIESLEKKEELQKQSISEYSSVQDILEKHGCKYIKEAKSKKEGFSLDIYLEFQYNTFEKNKSNQRYYENIINILENFIKDDFRLIDTSKDITIEIISSQKTNTYSYTINGTENYFEKENTKIEMEQYSKYKNTNFEINSEILKQIINTDWNKNRINFGSKDSTFNGYDIYFEEGIEIKSISKKIYNIVFTNKYSDKVINGISSNAEFEEIIAKLGEPTFKGINDSYIGYKNDNMYVFFTKDTISIIRNETQDMEEFETLLNRYINKEIDLKDFMNELTYLWDDYEEYVYDANHIYLNYPLKGIQIEMNEESTLGIKIYNNANITENMFKLIENRKVTGILTEDLVNQTMEKNLNDISDYKYKASLTLKESEHYNSALYYSIIENNKILFISKNEENVNKELKESISQGFFINDNMYIYSIENKGIYVFDILTNEKQTLITGEEKFYLEKFEDGILTYDDKNVKIME